MAYQLIPTRLEDQPRVLLDVACSREHHGTVAFACRRREFPRHWAFDADTGHYLVRLDHEEMRPEFENYWRRHAFCLGGVVYEVRLENLFGGDVTVKPICGAATRDAATFRAELTRAFAAHGRYGDPAFPEPVVPEFAPMASLGISLVKAQ